jgi:hypothetical protein
MSGVNPHTSPPQRQNEAEAYSVVLVKAWHIIGAVIGVACTVVWAHANISNRLEHLEKAVYGSMSRDALEYRLTAIENRLDAIDYRGSTASSSRQPSTRQEKDQ